MQHNYTEIELLQYLYDELDQEERIRFEQELQINPTLRNQLDSDRKMLRYLDRLIIEPDATTVDLILEYSALNSHKTPI